MNLRQNPIGKLLVLAGILLLISAILPWHIPLSRIAMAIAAIWVGIRLSGSMGEQDEAAPAGDGRRSFRHVFSRGVVNLTDSGALPAQAEIQCVFSHVTVRLPVDANITIHASSALGNIALPDSQSPVIGESVCRCGSRDPLAPRLDIRANCVLANLEFRMG